MGSRPYPSHNVKRQLDVMGGWMDLKRGSLTLPCDNMYTFSRYRLKVDHQQKQPRSEYHSTSNILRLLH